MNLYRFETAWPEKPVEKIQLRELCYFWKTRVLKESFNWTKLGELFKKLPEASLFELASTQLDIRAILPAVAH